MAMLWRCLWKLRPWIYGSGRKLSRPTLVVGSLRAGGGGRTTVARAIFVQLLEMGYKPALLCHPLNSGSSQDRKIDPKQDMRSQRASDEALLLAQTCAGDVWISKNRAKLIESICPSYDCFVLDDGLEDPRLNSATKIRLCSANEQVSAEISQLLPLGLYRSFPSDHPDVHMLQENEHYAFKQHAPINKNGEVLELHVEALLIAGLGDFERFARNMIDLGYVQLSPMKCVDHAPNFHAQVKSALSLGKVLVMSSKDLARLPSTLGQDPRIFVSSYELEWLLPIKPFLTQWMDKAC